MPKDYTQRRNERWETVFPGIGLESILGRILRIARYHNHKSTETMKPFGIKNGEADVLSALLHAGHRIRSIRKTSRNRPTGLRGRSPTSWITLRKRG